MTRPTGPFGFSRVTGVGPFVDEEASQKFTRKKVRPPADTGFHYNVARSQGIDLKEAFSYEARLEVEKEPEKSSRVGAIGEIEDVINSLTTSTDASFMQYWVHEPSGVAAIQNVRTHAKLRNMGIATQLKEQEMEHMRELGAKVVFTDVVTEGGYSLADKTGFKPIGMYGDETGNLKFHEDQKRGVMFKLL